MLLPLARQIFKYLPISPQQKTDVMYFIFSITGDRFKFLPSYQHYLRNSKWLKAPVPKDLLAYRENILRLHYRLECQPDQAGGGEAVGSGAALAPANNTMIMITHGLGGGTQQHVDDMSERLQLEGWRVLQLQRHNKDHLRLVTPSLSHGEPLFYRWPEEIPALIEDFRKLQTAHLHLHHTVDLPEDFLPQFYQIAASLGLPFDFTVHDYFSICPRFTLFDEAVRGYCGEPSDVRKCNACVKYQGSAAGKDIDVARWRQSYGEMLRQSRKVYVPDSDVGQRLQRYFPDVTFHTMPHPELRALNNLAAPYQKGQPLKLVTIGGIAPHKGSKVIYDCAEDALKRNLPLEFHLVGYSDIDHKLKSLKNVTVSGHFQLNELPEKLKAGGFHMAFLPAIWPETYNYVLSECWRHGFYTIGLDIGAIASRIKAAPLLGKILPYEWYFTPEKINDALLKITPPALQAGEVTSALKDYESFTRDYYQL